MAIFTSDWGCSTIAGVKPFELLGEAVSADGSPMKLVRRGDEYLILIDGLVLMSSRMHGSEEALATFGCERARTLRRPSVLIGGLGMGFTLRATLDLLPEEATVVVAELVPAVVEWNRGPLGPLAKEPLQDKRVRVEIGNVAGTIGSRAGQFDAVLLDVDNGPAALTDSNNSVLYDKPGIAAIHASLKKEGVLAIWAVKEDQKFVQRLRASGFDAHARYARGRLTKGGPRHIVFVARKV